jgi:two-component system, chemotaxis family, CheB/CheR fusion protein
MPSDPAAQGTAQKPAQKSPQGRPSILLVEDDTEVRTVSLRHLTDFGFHVHAVSNGPAAIEVLEGPEPFDLICTDVIMPGGVTGYGVADAAVALRPGIKILFITGYAGTSASHGQLRHPTAPMLHKPFTRKELAAAIHAALGGRAAR